MVKCWKCERRVPEDCCNPTRHGHAHTCKTCLVNFWNKKKPNQPHPYGNLKAVPGDEDTLIPRKVPRARCSRCDNYEELLKYPTPKGTTLTLCAACIATVADREGSLPY
jgi:hypothetical protein